RPDPGSVRRIRGSSRPRGRGLSGKCPPTPALHPGNGDEARARPVVEPRALRRTRRQRRPVVILLDVNVVLAAFRQDHAHHSLARPWLERTISTGTGILVPDAVWVGFVRLATNSHI